MRAWDESLELEKSGQIWKVNPFNKKIQFSSNRSFKNSINIDEVGWNNKGRSFGIHLTCQGTELDPLSTFSSINTSAVVGRGSGGSRIRKTILVETRRGEPGILSEWV